jgi:hypothetical protein
MLPKANPTGPLLKVELPCDLFCDRRHLLQQLLVLVVCAVHGKSSSDYVYRSLGEYDFMYAKTWLGMNFARCFM